MMSTIYRDEKPKKARKPGKLRPHSAWILGKLHACNLAPLGAEEIRPILDRCDPAAEKAFARIGEANGLFGKGPAKQPGRDSSSASSRRSGVPRN